MLVTSLCKGEAKQDLFAGARVVSQALVRLWGSLPSQQGIRHGHTLVLLTDKVNLR